MNVTDSFLYEYGLHESCYDFDAHVKDFISEMERGLSGQESSLLMLPSYLGIAPEGPPDGNVIAVDAGGTNLRVAVVGFTPGAAPVVSRHEKYRLPGSDGAVGKGEFFSQIAGYISDRREAADKVGFCFSFPSEICADRDGKIIGFNKEVKVDGSAGACIGAELNAAFSRAGKPAASITVLNDSAAVLIGAAFERGAQGGPGGSNSPGGSVGPGGQSGPGAPGYGGYIGLIYGTGVNICYYDTEKGMLINTEAGGYSGFRQSECDARIDAESDNPGDHRFEKMVSGAYFGTVALEALKAAAKRGLFPAAACGKILALTRLDAVSIDEFMRKGAGLDTYIGQLCDGDEDAALVYGIFDGIYERAAKLLAIAVTAVLGRCSATPERPGFIVAEGSAFSKGYLFRERFERHLMAHAEGGKPYELALADDHVLIGAAASAFL